MLGDFSLGQKIILWVVPLLFAITVHETAHGWVASKLGDPTAKLLGRLTLNPLKHIDPIGTIIVPAILFSLGGFIFGWAKPVPITWQNLKNPRRDMALVAAAGPLANLLMAFLWVAIAKVAMGFDNGPPIIYMAQVGISINLVLMLLNLIPIPPLDGSRVVASFLSPKMAYQFNKLEVYGFLILVVLLASGILGRILGPLLQSLLSVFFRFFGL
ncbi:MAG: site-2 protease family protein [Gammaproteobacteria bacterium]|nr:MAG: site-2 protease family protein [Gammaproteobacteria bacterium]